MQLMMMRELAHSSSIDRLSGGVQVGNGGVRGRPRMMQRGGGREADFLFFGEDSAQRSPLLRIHEAEVAGHHDLDGLDVGGWAVAFNDLITVSPANPRW